jgi:flagellar biosynthesis protein FliR
MIKLYIPILIFSYGCPLKIRLGIVCLMFKKYDIHRSIDLFENRRITFITLLVWRVSYKNALERGRV